MTEVMSAIRRKFIGLKKAFPNGNTDSGMLELLGVSFYADDDSIFGTPNQDYIAAEIDWYESRSRYVYDIRPEPPEIWKNVASHRGEVNSQYGYLLYDEENGLQYWHVLQELQRNPESRRAIAIYTRPTMHTDATADGMNDFVCTNAVSYFIREGALHAVVQMRSNDVVFGYRNDFAWQMHVLTQLGRDLGTPVGEMIWQAASLHVYPRHFHLIPDNIA